MYMCLGQQDKADLKTPLRKSENAQLLRDVIYEAISRKENTNNNFWSWYGFRKKP